MRIKYSDIVALNTLSSCYEEKEGWRVSSQQLDRPLAGNNSPPIRRRLMKTSLLSWRWMAPCAQATKMVMALLRPHTTRSIRERRRQRGQGVVDSKCARGPPVRWALPRCTRDPVRHELACHTTTRDSMPRIGKGIDQSGRLYWPAGYI